MPAVLQSCLPHAPMQEYLEDHPEVNFDVFLENVWENIKEIYRKPGSDEVSIHIATCYLLEYKY